MDEQSQMSSGDQVPMSSEVTSPANLPLVRDWHGRLLPGQRSLNPLGGPKKDDRKTVAAKVKELSDETNQRIVDALVRKAEAGEIRHIERIMDEQEGGALPQRRIPTSPNPEFEELTIQIREATLKTLKLRAPVEQEQDAKEAH